MIQPFPTLLQFEPIQLCNAQCFCCPYPQLATDKSYTQQRMSEAKMEALLDDFGGIRTRHNYEGKLRLHPFRYSDPSLLTDSLELILKKAKQHKLAIGFTTNGQNLTDNTIARLDQYAEFIEKISISFIGSSASEIRENMGLDIVKVTKNINKIKETKNLSKKLRITLRALKDTKEEKQNLDLLEEIYSYNLNGTIKREASSWLQNRISEEISNDDSGTFLGPISDVESQSPDRYVVGCSKYIYDRLEVDVKGNALLCCDDAYGLKHFGNVFIDGIDDVWERYITSEHRVINEKKYSKAKDALICAGCSRAVWSSEGKN